MALRIQARELRDGDWPISLGGWRPCSRVTRHRGGTVSLTIDGLRVKNIPGERSILVRRNPQVEASAR